METVIQQLEQWQALGGDPDEAEQIIEALRLPRLDERQLWAITLLLHCILQQAATIRELT